MFAILIGVLAGTVLFAILYAVAMLGGFEPTEDTRRDGREEPWGGGKW